MAEDRNLSRPRRRSRRSPRRRRVWPGRLLFLLLGIGGTFSYLEVREVGFEQAVNNVNGFFLRGRGDDSAQAAAPLTGGRVIEAEDADTRPLHEQDPRWNAAIALAEEGIKQREEALFEHYEGDEGDPFRLRDQMSQAKAKVASALVDLRAMREEYGHSRSSRVELDKRIDRYAKIAEDMDSKETRK
jgi:hypothetical protein